MAGPSALATLLVGYAAIWAAPLGASRRLPSRVLAPQRWSVRMVSPSEAGGDKAADDDDDDDGTSDAGPSDADLAREFDIAMRRTIGEAAIREREEQTIDNVLDEGRRQLDGIKADMDDELQRMQDAQAARLKAAASAAQAEVAKKLDEAEAVLRRQAKAADEATRPQGGQRPRAAGAGEQAEGGARRGARVVLVGTGGPLMRLVARRLVDEEGVCVRAVLAGDSGAKAKDKSSRAAAGLDLAWPGETAVGSSSSSDEAEEGKEGDFPAFEVVAIPQAQRFAVQRATSQASAVLVCLVDGWDQKECLDETTALRWVDGAGGAGTGTASKADSVSALPFPVAPVDVSGRLIVVASAQGTQRADRMPFSLRNVWGQLDSWRRVEQQVLLSSKVRALWALARGGHGGERWGWRLVGTWPRPGAGAPMPVAGLIPPQPPFHRVPRHHPTHQLRGHDATVFHLGKLTVAKGPKGAAASVGAGGSLVVQPGDSLNEECDVHVAAQGLARVLQGRHAAVRNATLSLASGPGAGATPVEDAIWSDQFLKCDGPELLRLPIKGRGSEGDVRSAAAAWLQEFARGLAKPNAGLPTAVNVVEEEFGRPPSAHTTEAGTRLAFAAGR